MEVQDNKATSLDVDVLSYTINRPGPLVTIRGAVYHYQSVGQATGWQATPERIRTYVGKKVDIDIGKINEKAIRDYINRL